MRLVTELKQCGFSGECEEFRRVVLGTFESLFPGETDEEVLCHPTSKAVKLCGAVRGYFHHDFPENLILKTLINSRKGSRRSYQGPLL